MKLFDYIRTTLASTLCCLVIVLIMNAVMLSSTALNKSMNDILYLDVLILIVFILYSAFACMRMKKRYGRVLKAIKEKKSIDYLLPDDSSFYSKILRDAVALKISENLDQVGSYKESMDELNNYIIKWVHEIKIPISVLELMLENSDTPGPESARKFKTELERIKFLANQVLSAGRASYYQEDLNISEFSLQKVVKEALKTNSFFFMSKNAEVLTGKLDFDVLSDEKWVKYILEQVLNNASKYIGQDGRVEISSREDEKTVMLRIRDNGIGIPPADISRIFDKGFTGENGRKASKSTGMGLYYAKKMADRMGVGLEVYSTAGEFTEFVLIFYKLSDYLNVTKM